MIRKTGHDVLKVKLLVENFSSGKQKRRSLFTFVCCLNEDKTLQSYNGC